MLCAPLELLGVLLPAAAAWLPLLLDMPEGFTLEDAPERLSCELELAGPALALPVVVLESPVGAAESLVGAEPPQAAESAHAAAKDRRRKGFVITSPVVARACG
jgi:hypothetical protein